MPALLCMCICPIQTHTYIATLVITSLSGVHALASFIYLQHLARGPDRPTVCVANFFGPALQLAIKHAIANKSAKAWSLQIAIWKRAS